MTGLVSLDELALASITARMTADRGDAFAVSLSAPTARVLAAAVDHTLSLAPGIDPVVAIRMSADLLVLALSEPVYERGSCANNLVGF